MRSADIEAILDCRPEAEFACRPGKQDLRVVRVRGLQATDIAGQWTFKASTDPNTGKWRRAPERPLNLMRSAEIVAVEEAAAIVGKRQTALADEVADRRKATRAAEALGRLGVACRAMSKRVVVDDVDALLVLCKGPIAPVRKAAKR